MRYEEEKELTAGERLLANAKARGFKTIREMLEADVAACETDIFKVFGIEKPVGWEGGKVNA